MKISTMVIAGMMAAAVTETAAAQGEAFGKMWFSLFATELNRNCVEG